METKLFEVRDAMTFVPCWGILLLPTKLHVLGIDIEHSEEKYLLRRAGFGVDHPLVLFGRLEGGESSYDPYSWTGGSRTMRTAHAYVTARWDQLESGDVIDVEFILGERETEKVSERESVGF